MNCLIVDDNEIARSIIQQLAGQVKELVVLGECASAVEAYNFLQENRVDLLFLDIEMPGMSGLELTRQLGSEGPVIVFTTSKKEYAVEAFELNVADYLVKPVLPARFLQAIERVREIADSVKQEMAYDEDEFLFIRDSNIVKRLKIEDILYVEAMGDYVKLHMLGKFYAIHTKLKTVEERLPAHKFIKVHRSYIVAVGKIDSIQDGALVFQGKIVPVADTYRAGLNKRMNIL